MPKRVLLDECLPRDLKKSLEGCTVRTVPEVGWAGKENGDLLALASEAFDLFVTVDRNLSFQQNLADLKIGVIVLVAPAVGLAVLANSLVAANWFLFLTGGLALVLMIVRTRIEERHLLARFGESCRAYAERTGRFVPKVGRTTAAPDPPCGR